MAQGMQVFKSNGEMLIDTSTLVGNLINSFTTTQKSGSITNSLLSTGTPFGFATVGSVPVGESGAPNYLEAPAWPTISISGNTLSWSWVDEESVPSSNPITIVYGVF